MSSPDPCDSLPPNRTTLNNSRHFSWIFKDRQYSINLTLSPETYTFLRSRELNNCNPSSPRESFYDSLISDTSDDSAVSSITSQFNTYRSTYQLSNDHLLDLIISFVQAIPYKTEGRKAKFPYLTLFEASGDCDDKSILLISLLRESNYSASLLHYPNLLHVAAGISCPESQIEQFCFLETTSIGFYVGDSPSPAYLSPTSIFHLSNGTQYSLVQFHETEREEVDHKALIIEAKKNNYNEKTELYNQKRDLYNARLADYEEKLDVYESDPTEENYNAANSSLTSLNSLVPVINSLAEESNTLSEEINSLVTERNELIRIIFGHKGIPSGEDIILGGAI